MENTDGGRWGQNIALYIIAGVILIALFIWLCHKSGEDKANLVWISTGQYLQIKHDTPAFENDPHYTYYNDKVENWLVNYSGGQLWYRQDSDDELSLLVYMQTDGIPDAIYGVGATDGKTLVVSYKTYKDFENVYNDYNKLTSGDSLRYAVIDLETGTVYK